MKILRQLRPYCWYPFLHHLFDLTELVLRWFLWSVHEILGPLIPTSLEKERPIWMWLRWVVLMPFCLPTFALLSLPALVSFFLKNILHQLRDPFIISFKPVEQVTNDGEDVRKYFRNAGTGSTYTAVTTNVCLLPGLLSKFNNLGNPKERAPCIGQWICEDQSYAYRREVSRKYHDRATRSSTRRAQALNESISKHFEGTPVADHVVIWFPHVDFLCFQETYDRDCSKLLIEKLHKHYPWVVYDAGQWSPSVNRCGFSSGLMVASRYEILQVDFKPFQLKTGVCKFISTGLLMVKVLLEDGGYCHNTKSKVGYIFNTHLQPLQGTEPIVDRQMSDILQWTSQFRRESAGPAEEVVFDILCGDFNTDNMSPADVPLSHHKLFQVYTDVCRERPGKDHDWTVGTEMRTAKLMDSCVSYCSYLKRVLDDPYQRQQYILDADINSVTLDSIYKPSKKTDANGNLILSPVGGKRRVDFVLCRKDLPLTVTSYNFVTRLASMTDHIPVSMTFSCK